MPIRDETTIARELPKPIKGSAATAEAPVIEHDYLAFAQVFIATVQLLTAVRIDHYSVVDDAGLASTLRPLGGVDVTLPAPVTSNGVTFHAGVNHLTSANALDYTEQPTLSEEGHALRQQALLRAILDKIDQKGLLDNPTAAFGVLNAFTKALSVDSNFSNSQLRSLALHMNVVGSSASTFVTAPVHGTHLNGALSSQLWNAIRNDKVSAFARQHPSDVTPWHPTKGHGPLDPGAGTAGLGVTGTVRARLHPGSSEDS